jgi:hypothetical protein
VTIPVTITNTGPLAAAYFADARLNKRVWQNLGASQFCSPFVTLPGACALVIVPTQVSEAQFVAQSNVPIEMDAFPYVGYFVGIGQSPDVFAVPTGHDTVTAFMSVPEVPWSQWKISPALIGPYGPAGAFTAPYGAGAAVLMKAFDSTVSSDAGDLWQDTTLGTQTFNPLILGPGQTGTINVTITPDKTKAGETVSGAVYIDTFNPVVSTGDEVIALPYQYTVTK